MKREYDRRRGSAASRGYDARWQRARDEKRRNEPRCEMCLERGLIVPATVVDHIVSIRERPDLRLVQSNLRSLCKRCHDQRTAFDQSIHRGHTRRLGCDASGWPIGQDHLWNR